MAHASVGLAIHSRKFRGYLRKILESAPNRAVSGLAEEKKRGRETPHPEPHTSQALLLLHKPNGTSKEDSNVMFIGLRCAAASD